MLNNDGHRRRPGEYVRPGQRLLISNRFPDSNDYYRRYPRGSVYNSVLPASLRAGQPIDLELVPEIFNWHDAQAVAIDYGGARIGYLPAIDAASWHDLIRAINRRGDSVWIRGTLEVVELDGHPRLVPALSLLLAQRLDELAEELGLTAVVERLLDRFDDHLKSEMLEWSWGGFPDRAVAALRTHSLDFPEFTWPTDPPSGAPPTSQAPGVLLLVLRGLARRKRRAESEERRRVVEEQRSARLAERAEEARIQKEAVQQRERDREERLAAIRAQIYAGWTTRKIDAHRGVTTSTAEKLKRKANPSRPGDHNELTRAARLERCARALALQRAGDTREAIAEELSAGSETIKSLLRDAKFFEAPRTDEKRLDLARAAATAREDGLTRSAFQSAMALSPAKAAEAWRDAAIIFR